MIYRKDNTIFQSYIKEYGLFPMVYTSYIHVDKVVVYTFVEKWQPETNTFHLPFGEMTITLDA